MKSLKKFLIYLFMGILLAGCNHKDLCYDHSHIVNTRILVDWKNFTAETPTGMSVIAYRCGSSEKVVKLTNTITHADLSLKNGAYQVLVYNQSPSEFGTIEFDGLEAYESAKVRAVERKRSWYKRDDEERVVHDPEWLASGSIDLLEIETPKVPDHNATRHAESVMTHSSPVFPLPRIYTLTVTVHVEGIQNLRSVRASLDGMAAGCKLSDGKVLNEKATQLLEHWEKNIDKDDPTKGMLSCVITSFGLPGNHEELTAANRLRVSALLMDNKTVKDFEFSVGERFEFSTEVNLELDLEVGTDVDDGPIKLPDVQPEGGFDVDVDDWGDEENIEIPV